MTYVQSAFRHCKPIAAWGDGVDLLANAGIDAGAAGVATAAKANKSFVSTILSNLSLHRHWDRAGTHPTRLSLGSQTRA